MAAPQERSTASEVSNGEAIVGEARLDWAALGLAVSSFTVDLISKMWARQTLVPGASISFLPPLLRLTYGTNTGAAFSMGSGHGWLVTAVATGVFLLLATWFWRRTRTGFASNLERFGLAILLGGASGNLFDRFAYGRVTDFLDFMFINFPIFNVADVLIDIGVGLIIIGNINNAKRVGKG